MGSRIRTDPGSGHPAILRPSLAVISRTRPAETYWDNPVQRLSPTDDLRFIDFFDFDESGFLDFAYYRVSISGSERHPHLAGHEALIAVQYAHVFVDEKAPS